MLFARTFSSGIAQIHQPHIIQLAIDVLEIKLHNIYVTSTFHQYSTTMALTATCKLKRLCNTRMNKSMNDQTTLGLPEKIYS